MPQLFSFTVQQQSCAAPNHPNNPKSSRSPPHPQRTFASPPYSKLPSAKWTSRPSRTLILPHFRPRIPSFTTPFRMYVTPRFEDVVSIPRRLRPVWPLMGEGRRRWHVKGGCRRSVIRTLCWRTWWTMRRSWRRLLEFPHQGRLGCHRGARVMRICLSILWIRLESQCRVF